MKTLLITTTLLLMSCRNRPTAGDYFDLWFVTPSNPFTTQPSCLSQDRK